MQHILEAARNLSDLFLCVHIWSGDTVTGLTRALSLVNPRRVILFDLFIYGSRTRQAQTLVDALLECIADKWKNLTIFEFPETCKFAEAHLIPFADVLKDVPTLNTVIIPPFWGQTPPTYLQTIAENPSLKRVAFRPATDPRNWTTLMRNAETIGHYPTLRGLLKLPEQPQTEGDETPTVTLLRFNTDLVPDQVWRRIFHFAFAINMRNPELKERQPYMGLVRVCKKFARLAQQSLHETIVLHRLDFSGLLEHFSTDPTLISAVRALHFSVNGDASFPPMVYKNMNPVILSGLKVTVSGFAKLAKHYGSTLQDLDYLRIAKSQTAVSPDVFLKLPNLISLGLSSKASFATGSVDARAMTRLQHLALSDVDVTVLDVFSKMDLPALGELTFSTTVKKDLNAVHRAVIPFLQKHGSKLWCLDVQQTLLDTACLLDLCPSLLELAVVCGKNIPSADKFVRTTGQPHPLETLAFRMEHKKGADKKWAPFFTALNLGIFPCLERITLPAIRWPTTEHEISKSGWVVAADRLLDHNVQLVDGLGVGWRKRLSSKRK
ncbi:hypothetical protein C8F01DRAFT_1149787 [Mycena amicta]|nr:hypothetical protein C8F01DRAFT_1149787 [Mycena amicta]